MVMDDGCFVLLIFAVPEMIVDGLLDQLKIKTRLSQHRDKFVLLEQSMRYPHFEAILPNFLKLFYQAIP